ncbi:helix-turn-helix domain-containing protein [Klebsiella pneumoniae]|uniref:helix-turn-helix domain-containing protein n=2 Tax=Klebsiella pneumoniae TaxID=573 RepID=UPI0007218898|nr:helix-turn-helix domain-containing protein [Klebsiella pneumoniae]MCS5798910.1 helix-turn-helix domain-containing protein [Klebsiella pneumoniae subsp. pneumoniae]ANE72309.1 hypothetical protein A7B01_22905 [Klebsiella pneumoniae]ASA10729.1 helix-turn-helix domain-containing protein [Klebsiella pneumoniae]ATX26353.1 helix-turn-helix domain-containing protein [Klebsiella pneumoniae]ATX29225.1 helix-turn-helix domain-containing protein [Klebsiella pneumoniae]
MGKTKDNYFKSHYDIFKINTINGKKFSISAKSIYSYLKSFSDAGLKVFPSHNEIADTFGITRNAAIKQIEKLIELGLIKRETRPGNCNEYHVLPIQIENTSGRTYSENKGTRHEVKGDFESKSETALIDDDDLPW